MNGQAKRQIFVLSDPKKKKPGGGSGGGCPRLLLDSIDATLRDDYYGTVKMPKNLLSKISSF